MESPIGNISEIAESDILIYPNPTKNILYIELPYFGTSLMSIYDINGKILYETRTDQANTTLDVQNLPNGVYHILINTNNHSYHKYFLIQND